MPGRGRGWKISVWLADDDALAVLSRTLVECGVDLPRLAHERPLVLWGRTQAEATRIVVSARAKLGTALANVTVEPPGRRSA